jgi:hypothetical protein
VREDAKERTEVVVGEREETNCLVMLASHTSQIGVGAPNIIHFAVSGHSMFIPPAAAVFPVGRHSASVDPPCGGGV